MSGDAATRLVVDASVAVKWFVDEEGSDVADALLDGRRELHAPRLMAAEVGNALWRKVRMGEMERAQAEIRIAAISQIAIRWADDETICSDAIRIAIDLDRAIYDCMYLALAHRIGATMATADTRFANALAGTEHENAAVALSDLSGAAH